MTEIKYMTKEQNYMCGYEDGKSDVLDKMWDEKLGKWMKIIAEQEQKSGKWIGIDEKPHEDYECSCCGYVVSTFTANIEPHTEYKYCPNCGAKMEREAQDD